MVSFDCPICTRRIENVAVHRGQTACPFCLEIVALPDGEPAFAEPVEPMPGDADHLEATPILDSAVNRENVERSLKPAQEPDEGNDSAPMPSVDAREVRAAEERMRQRRKRKIVISWLVLLFNLSALAGFTIFGIYMWEINQAASYICFSGAASTFFFLAVQFWPRKRRKPRRMYTPRGQK